MSDYPATPSYGAPFGAREQPNPSYLPPTYPNQYLQADGGHQGQMGSHYDTTMSAYGYNRAIPSFPASAVASGVPPLPIFQGWNQDPVPLPPYSTPQNGAQYPGYTNVQQSAQYYVPPAQPAYQQHVPGSQPYEQNGVTEGEFGDSTMPTHTPNSGYGTSKYRENGGTGYVDTAQRALYSKKDYSSQQSPYLVNNSNYSPGEPSHQRRHQSGSYSPYIAPGGADVDEQSKQDIYNAYAPSHGKETTNGASQSQYGWSNNGVSASGVSNGQTNGEHIPRKVGDPSHDVSPAAQTAPSKPAPSSKGRSVAESRKKAQGAILNLWPYEVRYQTYIDEGFSKEIVGSLFDELKMTRNSAKLANEPSSFEEDSLGGQFRPKINGKENLSSAQSASIATTTHLPNTDDQGLGKERTALASLGVNPSAISGPIVQHASPSTSTATAQTKPIAMTEKEKTLQSKMEALRKSREERAQKAAAKNVNKAPIAVLNSQAEAAKPPTPNMSTLSPPPVSSLPQIHPDVEAGQSSSTPSAPSLNSQPQSSLIPGLFLTSTTAKIASAATSPGVMPPMNQGSVRKRPVAADFDEVASSVIPYKRPFGHSRSDQRLVINVSDDEDDIEDEDVEMDLESQPDRDSPVHSARIVSDQGSATSLHNQPPLSNFPSRAPFTPPPNASATNTPPISNGTPNTVLDPVRRLGELDSELVELRKKIAAAKAQKRAKQVSGGSHTPRTSEDNGASSVTTTPTATILTNKVETAIQLQQKIEATDDKVALEQQRLTEAQAAESEKAAEVKKNEAEKKRLRREQIAAELARADADAKKHESELEVARAETAKKQAAVQEALEKKRMLVEEMERLGQDAEEQLQAQKDQLHDLNKQASSSIEDSPQYPPSAPDSIGTSQRLSLGQAQPDSNDIPQPPTPVQDVVAKASPPVLNGSSINLEKQLIPHVDSSVVSSDNKYHDPSPVEATSPSTSGEVKAPDRPSVAVSNDSALEAALQEAVRAEADSHTDGEEDMDIDDFYAPDPNQLDPVSPSNPVDGNNRSPEYSPTLDRTLPDVSERESDDYEPPEATPPFDEPESPPFSPAPPEVISDVNDRGLDLDMPDFDPAVTANKVEQSHTGENLPTDNGILPQLAEDRAEANNKPDFFTPYESPLKRFKAYRFHPNFEQDVPGGLRSSTYSHKIDMMKELCRYELAGGICNDSTCDLQHFRAIGLPDDAVLTALGSPEEFKGEQREQFCAGLKKVLMDLRVRKIRDFNIIASEIIAHRAKFLGDKSKVLAALEGTSI